jgi:nitrogen-specific signal transduction histidine kinase
MPNGGEFTVRTISVDRQVETPPRRQRFVHVMVKDTGHGLFREARVRAADPFFSTREGGTGLGLTSAAMIARSYRGWLHIESSDSGTSIHIHLPASSSPDADRLTGRPTRPRKNYVAPLANCP